jgi:hypothetical protein
MFGRFKGKSPPKSPPKIPDLSLLLSPHTSNGNGNGGAGATDNSSNNNEGNNSEVSNDEVSKNSILYGNTSAIPKTPGHEDKKSPSKESRSMTTTENIEMILKENKALRQQNENLLHEVRKLKDTIEKMDIQMAIMGASATGDTQVEYFTDEEELALETCMDLSEQESEEDVTSGTVWDWAKNKMKATGGKRKGNEITPPTANVQKMRKVTKTGNEMNATSYAAALKQEKPKPIFVTGEHVMQLVKIIEKVLGHEDFLCKELAGKQVKVMTTKIDDYRKITGHFNKVGTQWYGELLRSEKPIRVVIKGLSPSIPEADIIKDLKDRNYKVFKVVNMQKRVKDEKGAVSKVPMPMHMIEFDNSQSMKDIEQVKHILHIKVKVEPWRKPKGIPQCRKCQAYGHTQRGCHRQPRCVKCADTHLTAECKLPRDKPAKCAGCGEHHPANYKKCTVYTELVDKLNKKASKGQKQGTNAKVPPQPETQKKKELSKSKIEPKAKPERQQQETVIEEKASDLVEILKNLSVRLDKMDELNRKVLERLDNLEKALLSGQATSRKN